MLRVALSGNGTTEPCKAMIEGQAIDPLDEAAIRAVLAKHSVKKTRKVEILADEAVPYRCIGGLIYYMQAAGHRSVKYKVSPRPPAR